MRQITHPLMYHDHLLIHLVSWSNAGLTQVECKQTLDITLSWILISDSLKFSVVKDPPVLSAIFPLAPLVRLLALPHGHANAR